MVPMTPQPAPAPLPAEDMNVDEPFPPAQTPPGSPPGPANEDWVDNVGLYPMTDPFHGGSNNPPVSERSEASVALSHVFDSHYHQHFPSPIMPPTPASHVIGQMEHTGNGMYINGIQPFFAWKKMNLILLFFFSNWAPLKKKKMG